MTRSAAPPPPPRDFISHHLSPLHEQALTDAGYKQKQGPCEALEMDPCTSVVPEPMHSELLGKTLLAAQSFYLFFLI